MINTLEIYKKQHNVLITNKANRDQIFMKLRMKLAIDFLLNLNLLEIDSFEATKYINYLINFAKIPTILKFDEINKIIKDTKSEKLQDFPNNPEQICREIKEILPFQLPLKDKRQTGSIARTLRYIFKFTNLPDSYFDDNRLPLPNTPWGLHESIRDLFPITTHLELKNLTRYKAKLQTLYIFKRIPDTYFDLPGTFASRIAPARRSVFHRPAASC